MTIRELYYLCLERLSAIYQEQECRTIAARLLTEFGDYPAYILYISPNEELKEGERYQQAVEELTAGRPLQYLLGYEDFYGHRFAVGEGVLIPRPETEELVHLVAERMKGRRNLHILDICTGSGCIAWSLASEFPDAKVEGCDISEDALGIAAGQSRYFPNLPTAPRFFRCDILKERLTPQAYSCIVSNPPYVLESERALMRSNVVGREPEIALFVPDADPLLFYRAIAERAFDALSSEGKLFFEINERFGPQVCEMLEELGFCGVELHKDLFGKNRMVSASLGR